MAVPFNRIDQDWVHVRSRPPPLASMPSMWQASFDQPKIYHSSHCDNVQRGWKKWTSVSPDFYAHRAEATHPDWYTRKVNNIRGADTQWRLWPWEKTSRPTERNAYDIQHATPHPVQRGYQAVPHWIEGQVQMPRWGLYHPPHYQEPGRVEPLPPIHADEKHM